MAKLLADYGKIDILINNAGVGMRQPFVDMPLETVEEIMRTELSRRGLLRARSVACP